MLAGIFTGLIAANKINMAILAVPYLLVLFLNCRGIKCKLIFAAQAFILIVAVWLLVFLAVGGFHVSWLISVLPPWYNFLTNPGGDEGFGALRYLFFVYEIAGLILISGFFSALLCTKNKQDTWLYAGLTVAVLMNAVPVFIRPAGTTMFDMALVEMVFGFAFLTILRNGKLKSRMIMALAVIALVDAGLTFPVQQFFNDAKESHRRADEQWDFFHTAAHDAGNRPVTYYLPDNSHQFGDVFIIMLKGASVFPTWVRTNDSEETFRQLWPKLQFRFDESTPGPRDPVTTPVLIWIDKIGVSPLTEHYVPLAQALRKNVHSKTVPMPDSGTIGHIVDLGKE